MKKSLILMLVLSFLTFSNSYAATNPKDAKHSTSKETKWFNKAELAEHNGMVAGKKMMVAIDGFVYEIVDVKGWDKGENKKMGIKAGTDISKTAKEEDKKAIQTNAKRVGQLSTK